MTRSLKTVFHRTYSWCLALTAVLVVSAGCEGPPTPADPNRNGIPLAFYNETPLCPNTENRPHENIQALSQDALGKIEVNLEPVNTDIRDFQCGCEMLGAPALRTYSESKILLREQTYKCNTLDTHCTYEFQQRNPNTDEVTWNGLRQDTEREAGNIVTRIQKLEDFHIKLNIGQAWEEAFAGQALNCTQNQDGACQMVLGCAANPEGRVGMDLAAIDDRNGDGFVTSNAYGLCRVRLSKEISLTPEAYGLSFDELSDGIVSCLSALASQEVTNIVPVADPNYHTTYFAEGDAWPEATTCAEEVIRRHVADINSRMRDSDGDTVCDNIDLCDAIPDAEDYDVDNWGDADNDSVGFACDNCPANANPNQADSDGNQIGDACDKCTNRPIIHNNEQVTADNDGDGWGNACDICVSDFYNDCDGDTLCANEDPNQYGSNNSDGDAFPDCAKNPQGQYLCAAQARPSICDNCPTLANPGQHDKDNDGLGDLCDPDRDGDGRVNVNDNCPDDANPDQKNSDSDYPGDVCDPPDQDGDGIVDSEDNCPKTASADQTDTDHDEKGDICDDCPNLGKNLVDNDHDCVHDLVDNCPPPHSQSKSEWKATRFR